MKSKTTGNLSELLPLRLRLREELQYFREDDTIYAESREKECDYVLHSWQYEMLIRMDGSLTFEQLIEQVGPDLPCDFGSDDWLAFYAWLYSEKLIVCEATAVFEIVKDHKRSKKIKKGLFAALKMTAILMLVMGVLRISWVIAPAFEPGMDRVYASVENWFLPQPAGVSRESGQKLPSDSGVTEISLSGAVPRYEAIEKLRRQLAACRVRRDEYYLQNDEAGYRREVRNMGELARQIGGLDANPR